MQSYKKHSVTESKIYDTASIEDSISQKLFSFNYSVYIIGKGREFIIKHGVDARFALL